MSPRDLLPGSLQIPLVIVAVLFSVSACSELKVLVRLKDGQITQEVLEADGEQDTITLEFRQGDGTLITFLADFKRNVKVLRALVLGEPERGQMQYQALCFITTLQHGDIIPSEAMARLRQKNPHVVRIAEEKRGVERMSMDVAVNLTSSWHLSSHIRNICRDARDLVLTRQQDVQRWLEKGVESSVFQSLEGTDTGLRGCDSTPEARQPCTCSYDLRLEWYPCALKYCRGRGPGPSPSPYRCGIRSCSKGYHFDFHTSHRQLCMWDEGR
ncbi:out at first protein homolog [Brachyhypopomus gauderio]|uniref:out at first protein homolog n=1 Tax=Brachyhypopomus gauderio TaxID=698409 RepID=UPI004042E486